MTGIPYFFAASATINDPDSHMAYPFFRILSAEMKTA